MSEWLKDVGVSGAAGLLLSVPIIYLLRPTSYESTGAIIVLTTCAGMVIGWIFKFLRR